MILLPDKTQPDSDEPQRRRPSHEPESPLLPVVSRPAEHTDEPKPEEYSARKKWKKSIPRWRRKAKRRCHTILMLLLLGYFFATFVRPRVLAFVHRYRDIRHVPIPSNIALGRCANFSAESHTAFEFDMSLDAGYLLAHGGLASGQVVFSQSTNNTSIRRGSRSARVIVDTISTDSRFYEYVRVCEIRDRGWRRSSGVGIFTIPWRPGLKGHFQVSVELPANAEAPLEAGNVRIDMPYFSQEIGCLRDVHFDRFEVYSSHASITADANIDIDLGLHDPQLTPEEKYSPVTSAVLRSTHGHIHVYSNFTSRTGTHGAFKIDAATTKGDVDIGFVTAPINSSLYLDASTSFNEVGVSVHPAFEGSFRLGALFPWQKVHRSAVEPVPRDPTGKGRPRVLHDKSRGLFWWDGAVVWGRGNENAGYARLRSWFGTAKFMF